MVNKIKSHAHIERKWNVLAILGFVLAFIPVWALIAPALGVISLIQIKTTKEKGKGLAIASIVLPIFFIIFISCLIGFLIIRAENQTRKEAEKYGLSSGSYTQLRNSVENDCYKYLQALDADINNTNNEPYVASDIDIYKVSGDFASGDRTCGASRLKEKFIAENRGRWKVIFTGEYPDCSWAEEYNVPADIAPKCLSEQGELQNRSSQVLSSL